MLRTRLWMGAILIALAVGVLVIDQWLDPYYPFLLLLLLVLALVSCFELLHLLSGPRRPPAWLCFAAVALLALANWPAHLPELSPTLRATPWTWIAGTFAAVVLAAFLWEMAVFREAGESVNRIALTLWIAAYVGVLPAFFAQLRWLEPKEKATLGLALAIFVPKCCDIGAYFTGRLLGRHHMTPVLSPKKTWEGFAGGMVVATLTAVGINLLLGSVLPWWAAIGFGLTVGVTGVLGDLAESLIKRDCRQKDASQVMPGFGGVLDVVDAIIFAAPVSYAWLAWA